VRERTEKMLVHAFGQKTPYAGETTGETTSHPTKLSKNDSQVIGYSHATKLSKYDSQVAGYQHELS
jgi:hypothetical protein